MSAYHSVFTEDTGMHTIVKGDFDKLLKVRVRCDCCGKTNQVNGVAIRCDHVDAEGRQGWTLAKEFPHLVWEQYVKIKSYKNMVQHAHTGTVVGKSPEGLLYVIFESRHVTDLEGESVPLEEAHNLLVVMGPRFLERCDHDVEAKETWSQCEDELRKRADEAEKRLDARTHAARKPRNYEDFEASFAKPLV